MFAPAFFCAVFLTISVFVFAVVRFAAFVFGGFAASTFAFAFCHTKSAFFVAAFFSEMIFLVEIVVADFFFEIADDGAAKSCCCEVGCCDDALTRFVELDGARRDVEVTETAAELVTETMFFGDEREARISSTQSLRNAIIDASENMILS